MADAAPSKRPAAAILAIGDELLSGRTQDANIHYLAGWLTARGVALAEARIIGDAPDVIAQHLNALRDRYAYVFTSGGIGPTHDDLTIDAVAAAFDVPVAEHPMAIAAIETWYAARGEPVTPARRRMARTPHGAELIANAVSGAPGVRIDNVFVMAGVPSIFRSMLDAVAPRIVGGAVLHARAVTAPGLPESRLADALRETAAAHPDVAIGSYPIDGDEKGVTVVARAVDAAAVDEAINAAAAAMRALGVDPVPADRK